jgi:hypothetical protein
MKADFSWFKNKFSLDFRFEFMKEINKITSLINPVLKKLKNPRGLPI